MTPAIVTPALDHGKCKLAALATKALLDGLDCNDDERLTVLANLAAWAWQDVPAYARDDAMLRWLAIVQRDASRPRPQ
jgi:hypothetical protein